MDAHDTIVEAMIEARAFLRHRDTSKQSSKEMVETLFSILDSTAVNEALKIIRESKAPLQPE